MIPSWAKVGAKVVCIDARWNKGQDSPLRERTIYTVSAVFAPRPGRFAGKPTFAAAVDFVEAINPTHIGFNVCRFRPLVSKTQEQDTAMFLDLLAGMPVSDRLDELERRLERTP